MPQVVSKAIRTHNVQAMYVGRMPGDGEARTSGSNDAQVTDGVGRSLTSDSQRGRLGSQNKRVVSGEVLTVGVVLR